MSSLETTKLKLMYRWAYKHLMLEMNSQLRMSVKWDCAGRPSSFFGEQLMCAMSR